MCGKEIDAGPDEGTAGVTGAGRHHCVGLAGLEHLAEDRKETINELLTGPTWVDDGR